MKMNLIKSILIGIICWIAFVSIIIGGANYSENLINSYAKDWVEEYYDTDSYSCEFIKSLKFNDGFYYMYKICIDNEELILLIDSIDHDVYFEVYSRTTVDAKMIEVTKIQ